MKKTALLALCIAAALPACTPAFEDNISDTAPTTAEGVIVDALTSQPIPNANVYLSVENKATGSNTGGSAMDYQLADEKGHFSFTFKAHDNYDYFIYAEAPAHFYLAGQGGIIYGIRNTSLRVELQPKGYIRFNFHNASPQDTLVGITLPNLLQPIDFLASDTSIYSYIAAGQQTRIDWWMKHKGDTQGQSYKANVFVQPGDTFNVNVNY